MEVCSSVDELAIEESKAYSQKMSKWRTRAMSCLGDRLWWTTVEVMFACRQPLSHLSNFLHQKQDHKEWGHVAQLVTGKAAAIQDLRCP